MVTLELRERIMAAHRELKLAQEDGADDWVVKATRNLNELLDQLPREGQQSWNTTASTANSVNSN